MNKDVLTVAPKDDINHIISQIENAKEKIVAIVPSEAPCALHVAANFERAVKSAQTAQKTLVLVTTNERLITLAAQTHTPITKDLNTVPVIPTSDSAPTSPLPDQKPEPTTSTEKPDDAENPTDSKNSKNSKKPAKPLPKNPLLAWLVKHKTLCIIGSISAIILILILIWALIFAPFAKIAVTVRTNTKNFSENINFTDKLDQENATAGKFYLEEQKSETSAKLEFTATGKKNIGDKASGEVVVRKYIKTPGGKFVIDAGTLFTYKTATFTASAPATLEWPDNGYSLCLNEHKPSEINALGCLVEKRVKVTALEPGTSYNIPASNTDWSSSIKLNVLSDTPMSGGTDNIITVVQQSDLDSAQKSLAEDNTTEAQEDFFKEIPDDRIIIKSSFTRTITKLTSSPALGEEVKAGITPAATANITAKVFVINKTKAEEFITEKAKLSQDQKIYQVKNPFIENFLNSDKGYIGQLKTPYVIGPKITNEDILEKVKGRRIGEAVSILKSINGIGRVDINTSFFWVTTIPGDPNKISIELKVGE